MGRGRGGAMEVGSCAGVEEIRKGA